MGDVPVQGKQLPADSVQADDGPSSGGTDAALDAMVGDDSDGDIFVRADDSPVSVVLASLLFLNVFFVFVVI